MKVKRKWYNNGIDEKMFEINKQPTNWLLGRLPFSEETKKKSSQSAKNRGSNNKGKKLSDKARDNMSKSKRRFLEEHPEWRSPTQWAPGNVPWNKGVPMKQSTKEKLSVIKTGAHLSEESRLSKIINEKNTRVKNSGSVYDSYSTAAKKGAETRAKHSKEDSQFDINIKLKTNSTIINKYGSFKNYYAISIDKRNKTILDKYGSFDNYYSIICDKQVESKRLSGKWGNSISKAEDEFYNNLLIYFDSDDIIRQYQDERYPYRCDFYIKSLDLFIELNLFWHHGHHPFNKDNEEDVNLLNYWRSRQGTYINYNGIEVKNQFYCAEHVWTVGDVKKINIAKMNNLNYILLYNKGDIDDFFRWIQEEDTRR